MTIQEIKEIDSKRQRKIEIINEIKKVGYDIVITIYPKDEVDTIIIDAMELLEDKAKSASLEQLPMPDGTTLEEHDIEFEEFWIVKDETKGVVSRGRSRNDAIRKFCDGDVEGIQEWEEFLNDCDCI